MNRRPIASIGAAFGRLFVFLAAALFFGPDVSAGSSDLSLLILKGERRLEVRESGRTTKAYPIGLGTNPTGTKLRQGDGRTPEGTFYVCVKNPMSRFHLSLGLSYPTPADASRALREKLITQAQHDAIVTAHRRRASPPWSTALGGEIFIHGCGSSSDWTLGCIALDDEDMTELFALVEVGTEVEIRP